jgi:PEP-CTERM motif
MFNGYEVGNNAAGDLAGALNQFSVLGIDQMNCVQGCSVLIPYNIVDAAKDTWSAQVQTLGYAIPYYGPSWYVDSFPFGWCGCDYLSGNSWFWWGVFTPVSAPEPATYGLMVLGLAGAALARRRRARYMARIDTPADAL